MTKWDSFQVCNSGSTFENPLMLSIISQTTEEKSYDLMNKFKQII